MDATVSLRKMNKQASGVHHTPTNFLDMDTQRTRCSQPRIRGLAVMRPACHLDTQNTVDTQKFMSEFAKDDFS